MAEEKKSLAAKLAEIMSEVERIAKKGRNDFHKYDYATESDTTAAIRQHLADRKIVILPRVTKWTQLDKAGDKGQLVYVDLTFTLLDGESGEALECPWLGCGEDKGDKALYKGYTGALKYFLLKLFLIPTGDDPEQNTKKERKEERRAVQPNAPTTTGGAETLTGAEIQRVFDVAKKAGYKQKEDIYPFTRDLFGVEAVKLVPRSGLEKLLKALAPDLEPVSA